MKRKAMYSKNSGRYNFNGHFNSRRWNSSNNSDGSSHDNNDATSNNNNGYFYNNETSVNESSSSTTTTTTTTTTIIQPPSSLKEAIHQFQQVLWTQSSLPKAITILNTYPTILSHQNKIGSIPLHTAIKCTQSSYRSQIIQLIIEKGIEYNVGGRDGRGGLLMRQLNDNRTALCLLVVGDDKTDILRYLTQRMIPVSITPMVNSSSSSSLLSSLEQQQQKPLLSPQDVIDYQLLHRAAGDPFLYKERIKTIQFLINLCPQALASRSKKDNDNANGDLPIHHLCRQRGYDFEMLKVFFTEGMKYGVYLEKDGKGRELLNCCMENHILPLLDCVQDGTIPILQNVIGVVSREILQRIISNTNTSNNDNNELFQAWCHVKDKKGRLPLHYATEIGMKYDHELKYIFEANTFATNEIDPMTNLYPFCLAACMDGKKLVGEKEGSRYYYSPNSGGGYLDLTSIYLLARSNPNHVGYQS